MRIPRLPALQLAALLALTQTYLCAGAQEGLQHPAPAGVALCDSCHGLKSEGLEALGAPRLAGVQPWYLERQLRNFRSGIRGSKAEDLLGQQMKSIADTLPSDSTIKEVAGYLSGLRTVVGKQTLNGDPVRGKQLYARCTPCHGADAEGIASQQAPRLRGANDWYVSRQLQAFRSGARGNDPQDTLGAIMRPIASSLPDEQSLEDLAIYVGTLQ